LNFGQQQHEASRMWLWLDPSILTEEMPTEVGGI
jgi:hypothetical protein